MKKKRQAGFTLAELMVAITVTGIVALLVYGALDAAVDTGLRVEARGRELRAEAGWRALVSSALRNARPAIGAEDGVFLLEDGRSAGALPADRVTFITSGGLPPLTSDVDWQVTLGAGPDGVVLAARPLGIEAPERRILAPGSRDGLEIRVRGDDSGAGWRADWPARGTLPRAVELTFWTEQDGASGPLRLVLPR